MSVIPPTTPPAPNYGGYGYGPESHSSMGMAPIGGGTPPRSGGAGALFKAFGRHWVLALTLGLLCSGAAAALCYKLMPGDAYTARSSTRVLSIAPSLLDPIQEIVNARDAKIFQKNQQILVKSRKVLAKALARPEIKKLAIIHRQPEPLSWLEDELKVDFQGEVLTISLSGNDDKELTHIVKAVTEEYHNALNEDRFQRTEALTAKLKLLAKFNAELEEKRNRLNLLGQQTETGSNNEATLLLQHQTEIQRKAEIERELSWAQIERKKAEIKYNQAREQYQPNAAATSSAAAMASTVETLIAQDPNVVDLRDQIQQIETNIRRAGANVRNQGVEPTIRKARREIEDLQAELEAYIKRVRPEAQRRAQTLAQNPAGADGQIELAELSKTLNFYRDYEKVMEDEASKIQIETKKVGDAAVVAQTLQDEIRNLTEHHPRPQPASPTPGSRNRGTPPLLHHG